MSELAEPFTEREITLSYLEHERGRWLEYRSQSARNNNMDARQNKRTNEAMQRIDYLLDELGSLILQEVINGPKTN